MEATTTTEVVNLIQSLASLNLGYLGLCVTIILSAGGFFYLFNFKPLQDSLEKYESKLQSLNTDVDNKLAGAISTVTTQVATQTQTLQSTLDRTVSEINSLKKDAFEKIDAEEKELKKFTSKAESELNDLKRQYKIAELDNLWREHYMWDGRKVPANALTVLMEYMEKALNIDYTILVDLWADAVTDALEKIKRYDDFDGAEIHTRLLTILGKIPNLDLNKKEIKDLASKVFDTKG